MFRFIIVAVVTLVCGSSLAFAACYPRLLSLSPAQNYSAYYYRSPGGIGPPRQGLAIYGHGRDRQARETTYPKACGSGRKWDGTRCVDARKSK